MTKPKSGFKLPPKGGRDYRGFKNGRKDPGPGKLPKAPKPKKAPRPTSLIRRAYNG